MRVGSGNFWQFTRRVLDTVGSTTDAANARSVLGLGALAILNTVSTAVIDAAAVIYSKIQNVTAARLLGNPTGGAAAPSEISLGSGLSFNGTTMNSIQTVVTLSTAISSTAVLIPADNTTPQNTEGAQVFSVPFTPKSASSRIFITVTLLLSHGTTGADLAVTLFVDAGANAVSTGSQGALASVMNTVTCTYDAPSASTSSRTYAIRYGGGSATTFINRTSLGNQYNGTLTSYMIITEYI